MRPPPIVFIKVRDRACKLRPWNVYVWIAARDYAVCGLSMGLGCSSKAAGNSGVLRNTRPCIVIGRRMERSDIRCSGSRDRSHRRLSLI